jgi:hypothetical protein
MSARGEIPEPCDVQEGDLVGAFLIVPSRQFHGLSEVPDDPLFPDIVLVPLGHDEVALVVRADVQAGDDPLG